jgi:predicted dehydrogenase
VNPSQKRTRWGIAGTGQIAAQFSHAAALVHDCEIVAVASRSAERAESFGETHGIGRRFESYEAMADSDEDLDAVYIATPHIVHESHTLLYLRSGRSVLCEKPFALSAAEAQRMIEAARGADLFLMEAMWSRYVPSYVKLRELLHDEVIGPVRMVEANLGYRTLFDPLHHKYDLAKAGGALLDLGVYPAQLCSLVLGRPDGVVAAGHLGSTGVDEQVAAVLHHAGGALGVIEASIAGTLSCSARIYGTVGTIELPAFMHCPQFMTIVRDGASEQVECANEGNGLQFEIAEVGRCLRAGLVESPSMPLDETVAILQTLDSIREQIGLTYPSERR